MITIIKLLLLIQIIQYC